MATNIPADVRARNFNQSTRRNLQYLGSQTGAENGSVTFNIPKARLLAGLKLMVNATLTATHASSPTYTAHEDAPFKFIKRVTVSMNNGFNPFSVSGQALYAYNCTMRGAAQLTPATSGRGAIVQGLTASSGGTANTVRMCLDVPIAINPRDPIGLLMLQDDATLCTVTVDLGAVGDLAPAASNYSFAVSAVSVGLSTDTYSIPANPDAFPDISVLKFVQERTETIVAAENIIKLPVGQTYRKLGFVLYSTAPARQADSIITSPISLIFNQADTPINITAAELAAVNAIAYGGALPSGIFWLDFADQGLVNLGGSRDYIDTQKLTEFWLRFTSSAAGSLKVITETVSRLG